MKQSMSPAVAVIVVLIVLVVVGAIGYFVFMKPKEAPTSDEQSPEEMEAMGARDSYEESGEAANLQIE